MAIESNDNLVTINPLTLDNITRDGTSRDFEAMLNDFKTVFPLILPEYSSLEDDDYGVSIVQFILWMLDNLNYQHDFYVQQRTKKWCKSRQFLADILEWFNYYMTSASPARTDKMKFYLSTFPVGYTDGITIPKYTLLQTGKEINGDYIDYETMENLILEKKLLVSDPTGTDTVFIGAGNTTNFQVGYKCEIKDDDTIPITATLLEKDDVSGSLKFDKVISTDYTVSKSAYVAMLEGVVEIKQGKSYIDPAISSTGRPFQEFSTVRNNVIDDTIILKVDGVTWTKKNTVLFSEPEDEVFQIRKTIDNKVICITGDGYSGKIPTGNIVLSYRVGGGRIGNVGKNVITTIKDNIVYHGVNINIACTNDEATLHGGEMMTLERAKIVGPSTIAAIDRALTKEDFESLLENYTGVSRVSASKTNDNVAIYLLGNGVTAMTTSEKQEILEYLDKRRVGSDGMISIYDPKFPKIDITIQIKMKKNSSKTFLQARTLILSDIQKFFDPDQNSKLNFGKTDDEQGNIYSSDIYNIADDDKKDVEYALIPRFTIAPSSEYSSSWPNDSIITSIQISQDYDNSEFWTITCLNVDSITGVAEFQVKGSVSGLQDNKAYSGSLYKTDDDSVSFLIQTSSLGFEKMDCAILRVLPNKNEYLPINDSEFPVQGSIVVEEIK